MSIEIDTISFTEAGLAITYLNTDEVRVGGQVVLAHQIMLNGSHPDYREDALRISELAESVVANALEDWAATPPHADPDEDVDDELGMGE